MWIHDHHCATILGLQDVELGKDTNPEKEEPNFVSQ